MICRLLDNENYLSEMFDKDEVFLTISYVECEYVWSKPTGEHNASLSEKYLNKYVTASVSQAINNQTESKSAAAMLRERDEQLGNKGGDDSDSSTKAQGKIEAR